MREPFPLDYESRGYAYVERPNAELVALLARHALGGSAAPAILDVGAGAGANARALRARRTDAFIVAVEPDARAAELARAACDHVVTGTLDDFARTELARARRFDAVILSDVIEHVVEPVRFLRSLIGLPSCRDARYFVSVPNYAVWYNRLRTAAGRFDYAWSGLYDRTHLRFFTRRSVRQLLRHVGLRVVAERSTPSLVQSTAPLLRRFFEGDVARGEHLSLPESRAFRAYSRFVEPWEARLCALWPELLAFQIVTVSERELGSVALARH